LNFVVSFSEIYTLLKIVSYAVKDRKLRQRIEAVVMELEGASSLSELRNIKPIQGNPNFYRLKVGDYRLGIYVKDN